MIMIMMKIRGTCCLLGFFLVSLSVSSLSADVFWDDYPDQDGWRFVDNIGWLYPFENSGWSFHVDLDWIYSDSDSGGDIWFYRPRDWIWTNLDLYPIVWSNERKVWLFFDSGAPPIGDPKGGGTFRYPGSEYSFRWYWERYERVALSQYEIDFNRSIFRIDDSLGSETNQSETIEYVYNTDEIIQYLETHPKANGLPHIVLERIGQSEFERMNYDDFSRDEQRELRRAMDALRWNYNLRVFYNGIEYPKIEIKYDEEIIDRGAGSGAIILVFPNDIRFTYLTLWIS